MRVGIINVTGYAGVELARILLRHPEVELVSVTGRSAAGKKLREIFPHLVDTELIVTAELDRVDVAFSALPHKDSAVECLKALEAEARVIDLSADFRLTDTAVYKAWYGVDHPAPEHLPEAVYGLVELQRERIRTARLVASPGCYPTSAILGLAPALKHELIEGQIIVDSKSGVSGAGRTLSLTTHFSEVNENTQAYGLSGHRHQPEIAQELNKLAAAGAGARGPVEVLFVPHLIPMIRGILSTCYAKLAEIPARPELQAEIRQLYRDFYAGETFVKVTDAPPQTKHVAGSNTCLVYPVVDPRTNTLVVISCIDNLVKGAAGQAVQSMNVMLGLPEATGLRQLGLYP
ncbi:MAG: N-acetyl-gamma-glutamyl-phosphate reductase [Chloroflexota bacterium]|nr:MAG: N-acetyl-gamma-glutamyl-phosphate reductase [Chloroflexota bacterium]